MSKYQNTKDKVLRQSDGVEPFTWWTRWWMSFLKWKGREFGLSASARIMHVILSRFETKSLIK